MKWDAFPKILGRIHTLFELIMVMPIVGILTASACRSFKYVTASIGSRRDQLLVGDLQYAVQAIKQGLTVTVCPSTDRPDLQHRRRRQHVESGWIVLLDVNAINKTFDSGERTPSSQARTSPRPAAPTPCSRSSRWRQ